MSELDSARRAYHHGDLKTALLAAAEAILERDGIQALTLRGAARAAGVSHAAPTNHFGDLTGLLSELAAVGFNRFSAALTAAKEAAGDDPRTGSNAMGAAYVTFARSHPGLFVLMFRSERLDTSRPALRDAIETSRQTLRAAGGAAAGGTGAGGTGAGGTGAPEKRLPPLQVAAQAAARWSLVHGFAMLLLDGRLTGLLGSLPGGEDADDLLNAVLVATRIGD
jgi:AcrR family transcriptional regulator